MDVINYSSLFSMWASENELLFIERGLFMWLVCHFTECTYTRDLNLRLLEMCSWVFFGSLRSMMSLPWICGLGRVFLCFKFFRKQILRFICLLTNLGRFIIGGFKKKLFMGIFWHDRPLSRITFVINFYEEFTTKFTS